MQNNNQIQNQSNSIDMTGVVSVGAYMSQRNECRDIPGVVWEKLDDLLVHLNAKSITTIASELSRSALKIEQIHAACKNLQRGNLNIVQRTEIARFNSYAAYASSKVSRNIFPVDSLSAVAASKGLEKYKIEVSGINTNIVVPEGDNVKKIDAESALNLGFGVLSNVQNNIKQENNPRLLKYAATLDPSVVTDDGAYHVELPEVTIGGIPIVSITNAFINGRVSGDTTGAAVQDEITPSEKADITSAQGDMFYLCKEQGKTAKYKINIPETSKLVDIGLDPFELGINNDLCRSIIRTEFNYELGKKTDEELYDSFKDFVCSDEPDYSGPFNTSWVPTITKWLLKNNPTKIPRKGYIICNADYYYVTSGPVSWFCIVRNVPSVITKENDKKRWTDNTLIVGPQMVRRIFAMWNLARIGTSKHSLGNVPEISRYVRTFLVKQKISPQKILGSFCLIALSKLGGVYSVEVTTRDPYNIKKQAIRNRDLGLDDDDDFDYKELDGEKEIDIWGKYPNAINIVQRKSNRSGDILGSGMSTSGEVNNSNQQTNEDRNEEIEIDKTSAFMDYLNRWVSDKYPNDVGDFEALGPDLIKGCASVETGFTDTYTDFYCGLEGPYVKYLERMSVPDIIELIGHYDLRIAKKLLASYGDASDC